LRSAHEYSKKLNSWNEKSSTSRTCPRPTSEGSEWIVHDLPICSINCDAPVSCLVNDRCRCTRDRCSDEKAAEPSPSEKVAYGLELSYSYAKAADSKVQQAVNDLDEQTNQASLQQKVQDLPWDAVIQPSARHVFSLSVTELPKVHVVPLPETVDNHMQDAACYDVNKAAVPTTGDHFMGMALEERSVLVDEADFAFIPYYQGCYFNYLHENTYKKLADTVAVAETQIVLSDRLKASNIVLPFTHDWGSVSVMFNLSLFVVACRLFHASQCTGWWPLVEDVLSRTPPPPMSKAIAWQVNGDHNTRCIKAERDIIMPAVTKHIDALLKAYGDMSKVKPSDSRKHLGFFAGDIKGFGAFARTRIGCAASNAAKTNKDEFFYHNTTAGIDYIGKLGDSKFCLLPRGIAGW
jgi:hypothetical protein